MNSNFKKINIINILIVISSTCLILGIFLATFAPMTAIFKSSNSNDLPFPTKDNVEYMSMVWLSISFLCLYLVLSIATSIIIWITNWKNELLNNVKMKWSLLSLFLLGVIGNIIFSFIGIKELGPKNPNRTIE